ncbi:glycosyltransferase [Myxococcota bacterium]|nr:glycosyltransferase [Myxococcota bacterium]
MSDRLMLVGVFTPQALGSYLDRAAGELGLETVTLDSREGYASGRLVGRALERLRGRRPLRLEEFSARAVDTAREFQPRWCLTTGSPPLTEGALEAISQMGVRLLNFSSDDPWNPVLAAPWHLAGTHHYDAVFTPRPANLEQFRALGVGDVELLHFGYDPHVHRPASPESIAGETPAPDVVFIGGADKDRVPYAEAVLQTGLEVALYGGYWNRYRSTRNAHGGMLDLDGMRSVLARAKMSFCLVRRANRDQHVMRTYEEPAMGSCVAMEDTGHHRELFDDATADACFFKTPDELADRAVRLCTNADLRAEIRERMGRAVTGGEHRYIDRLRTLLALPSPAD